MFITGWSIGVVAIAVGCVVWRRRGRQRPADPTVTVVPSQRYQVPIPPPREPDLVVACPHCGFHGGLENLSWVGESVDCPVCEEPFVILEPEPAGSAAES